jgi:tRNA U34 5-carboxymethylaminomethyl modifying GTPase MnmE/TrmE
MKDTITALATPPGESGIAVIRVSGDEAIKIVADLFQGKALISLMSLPIQFIMVALCIRIQPLILLPLLFSGIHTHTQEKMLLRYPAMEV